MTEVCSIPAMKSPGNVEDRYGSEPMNVAVVLTVA